MRGEPRLRPGGAPFLSPGVLQGDAVLWFEIEGVEAQEKKPLQGLHQKVGHVGPEGGGQLLGERVAVGIIELPYGPVEVGGTLHEKLLEGVGHAELAVHHDAFAVAEAVSGRLYQDGMAAHRDGAEVVGVILDGGRGDLLGQGPVAGLGEGPDGGVGSLAEKNQDGQEKEQQGESQEKAGQEPAQTAGEEGAA